MSKTKIQWADEVWNPVTGCSKVSEGCLNCYAEKMALRLKKMGCAKYANGFSVTCHYEERYRKFPGQGKRIFVNSMSDLFHPDVSFWFIASVLETIEVNPAHTFMVLTKRPERAKEFFRWRERELVHSRVLPNLWLGVTAENQVAADYRIPLLLKTPAAVRFVSVEPMLEEVWFEPHYLSHHCLACNSTEMDSTHLYSEQEGHFCCDAGCDCTSYPEETHWVKGLDWVICGCESGPKRRQFCTDWARSLKDQCVDANVPFFYKQGIVNGKVVEMPELDGKVWAQLPEDKNQNQGEKKDA